MYFRQAAIRLFALTFLVASLLSVFGVLFPQKTLAYDLNDNDGVRFYYRMEGSRLVIRAESSGDHIATWVPNANLTNFTPSFLANSTGGLTYPIAHLGGIITKANQLPDIFVGERASDAELRGNGYNNQGITIDHADYVAAFQACKNAGTPTSACVSGRAESDNPSNEKDPGDDEASNCESVPDPMAWIMCPVIRALDGALNWVDSQIQRLLEVDRNYYDNPGMRGAFNNIRNIAYIILVPVVLVMVISTALGFDFISAYTVKRALPRLFIAVVFIALSFQIGVFLIEFFNEMGKATMGIITSPFSQTLGDVDGMSLSTLFEGGIVEGITSFIIAAPAVIIIFWLFGGTLLLAAGIAFLVLMLRQIFIVVFLLAAPLAILAWIFPGNDKLWKLWWNSFSKLLLMFPLIMAVLAVGRIFAFTIHESSGAGLEGSVMQPLMTIVAYMIPYAFIPFTFKFAGGLFATVAGMANDRSKGLFDRQRQARQGKMDRMRNQDMFRNAPDRGLRLRSRLNTAASLGMNAGQLGANPMKWRGRASKALRDNSILQREEMLKDDDYTWRQNDTLNAIASMSSNERELREWANRVGYNLTEDQVADVESMRRKYGNAAFRQATWRRAAAGGTVFDRTDLIDNGTANDLQRMSVWEAAAHASGGNRAVLNDLVGVGRGEMKNAGRYDEGGGGFGATYNIAERFLTNPGYTSDQARADLTNHVYREEGAGVLMHPQMKNYSVLPFMARMNEDIDTGVASGQADNFAHAMASMAAAYETGSNPNKTRAMRDRVMTRQLDIAQLTPEMKQMIAPSLLVTDPQTGAQYSRASGTITVGEALEGIRGSRQFQDFKREFQQSYAAQQQQMMAQQAMTAAQQPGAQAGGGPQGPQTGVP